MLTRTRTLLVQSSVASASGIPIEILQRSWHYRPLVGAASSKVGASAGLRVRASNGFVRHDICPQLLKHASAHIVDQIRL